MSDENQQDENAHARSSRRRPVGWKTADQLVDEDGGRRAVILERLQRLRYQLIHDIAAAGWTQEEANQLVEDNLIGYRTSGRSPTALTASPNAIRSFKEEEAQRAALERQFFVMGRGKAPKSEDWMTLRELTLVYQGGRDVLYERLRRLSLDLIRESIAAGHSPNSAMALVDEHLIGNHRVFSKQMLGPAGLAASPDAIRIGERAGLLVPKHHSTSAPLPDGWKTAAQLARAYIKEYRYRSLPIRERIQEIRNILIKDMQESGYSPTEAEALINDHLIGRRINADGNEDLAASPEAVRLGETLEGPFRLMPRASPGGGEAGLGRGR